MTDPVEALVAHWHALDAEERAGGVQQLTDLHMQELAGDDSFYAGLLRGLQT